MSQFDAKCGCGAPDFPEEIFNPPGRDSLDYRVAVFGQFKRQMRERLAMPDAVPDLATRDNDDPIIALTDAWAVSLDILSFYQERIANEGYLRTAIERRSARELARAIGYEPRPGLAASVNLAFTLESGPGAPTSVVLPIGTKAQTIPGQDELPQTFETVEELVALPAANAFRTRRFAPRNPVAGEKQIRLAGVGLTLAPGDRLLIVSVAKETNAADGNWFVGRIAEVEILRDENATLVTFANSIQGNYGAGANVYAVRGRAAIFGASAPDIRLLAEEQRTTFGTGTPPNAYKDFNIAYAAAPATLSNIFLDAVYSSIRAGHWVVLIAEAHTRPFRVTAALDSAKEAFTLAGKSTQLGLSVANEELKSGFLTKVRETTVYLATERLEFAEWPISTPVSGNVIEVEGEFDDDIPLPRLISIEGVSADGDGEEVVAESAIVLTAASMGSYVRLTLDRDLANAYEPQASTVYANVAPATHGETRAEILGSGKGSVPFQTFALKQRPLTYISAASASGLASTLEIRVNDVLWEEVDSLYFAGPEDRVYETIHREDGSTVVRFGDGKTGARLPTGNENVAAKYRVGSGLDGLADAGQISLLMSRPLGLKAVTNPEPPNGAADAESLEGIKTNAPRAILTFGRIVSLQDYEDFARGVAGIAKAQAAWVWDGERRRVVLTVASEGGAPLVPGSDLEQNLRRAIDDARHVRDRIELLDFDPVLFAYAIKVKHDPAYVGEDVRAAVAAALEDRFSFANIGLGEFVAFSEVARVAHLVEGVVGIDIDYLVSQNEFFAMDGVLNVERARWSGGEIQPCQLLTLAPEYCQIEEFQA